MQIESGAKDLDDTDFRILRALVGDGRGSDVVLGERVNLSISGYSAVINQKMLGFTITVLVLIELSSQAESKLVEFEEAVLKCPSMSFCSFISGENDFMMLINVKSFDDYDSIYRIELSNLPYVSKIRSSFLMREVARRRIAPVVVKNRA
jgi:DNA-binding Lrp family transcriptional regulator